MRTISRVAATTGAWIAIIAATSALGSTPTSAKTRVDPTVVVAVGDSLIHDLDYRRSDGRYTGELTGRLRRQGWWPLVIGVPGAATSDLLAELRVAARSDPDAVIIVSGSNDAARAHREPATAADAVTSIEEAAAGFADTVCVVWPTVTSEASYYWPAASSSVADINAAIGAAVGSHPNGRVADWASIVVRHPGWLAGDGLHQTSAGRAAFARLLIGAASTCLSDLKPLQPAAAPAGPNRVRRRLAGRAQPARTVAGAIRSSRRDRASRQAMRVRSNATTSSGPDESPNVARAG